MNLPFTFEKSPLLINAVSKVSFSSSIPFSFTSQVNRHFVLFAFSTFVHLGIIGNWFPSFRFVIEERISSKAIPQSLNGIVWIHEKGANKISKHKSQIRRDWLKAFSFKNRLGYKSSKSVYNKGILNTLFDRHHRNWATKANSISLAAWN